MTPPTRRSPDCSSGLVLAGTQACATHAACSSGNVMSASANAGPVRVSDAATAAVTAIDLTCVPPSVLMDVRSVPGAAHESLTAAHPVLTRPVSDLRPGL